MKIKDYPSWLKGGIVGLIIGILASFLFFMVHGWSAFSILGMLTICIAFGTIFAFVAWCAKSKIKGWLKGGLIGLGIILFIFVFNTVLDLAMGRGLWKGEFSMWLFVLASFPFLIIGRMLDNPPLTGRTAFLAYLLIVFAIYFIVGALIGLIISKIKSKKR